MTGTRRRPWSAVLLAACGLVLIGMGFYFAFARPPLLNEDERFIGVPLTGLREVAPEIATWLRRVFWVMGGYMAATGILTVHLARTGFRDRRRNSWVAALLAGVSSVGVMAVVNFAIDSDFRWALLGLSGLWAAALTAFAIGR